MSDRKLLVMFEVLGFFHVWSWNTHMVFAFTTAPVTGWCWFLSAPESFIYIHVTWKLWVRAADGWGVTSDTPTGSCLGSAGQSEDKNRPCDPGSSPLEFYCWFWRPQVSLLSDPDAVRFHRGFQNQTHFTCHDFDTWSFLDHFLLHKAAFYFPF